MPDIQAQADATPRRLGSQCQKQHSSDTSAANLLGYPDGDLRRMVIDIECRLLIAGELPRPRGADCHGI